MSRKICPLCGFEMTDRMTIWFCSKCTYSERKAMQSTRDKDLIKQRDIKI